MFGYDEGYQDGHEKGWSEGQDFYLDLLRKHGHHDIAEKLEYEFEEVKK